MCVCACVCVCVCVYACVCVRVPLTSLRRILGPRCRGPRPLSRLPGSASGSGGDYCVGEVMRFHARRHSVPCLSLRPSQPCAPLPHAHSSPASVTTSVFCADSLRATLRRNTPKPTGSAHTVNPPASPCRDEHIRATHRARSLIKHSSQR